LRALRLARRALGRHYQAVATSFDQTWRDISRTKKAYYRKVEKRAGDALLTPRRASTQHALRTAATVPLSSPPCA